MAEVDCELVSVIIPTRNRRDRLERAIASVLQQTWSNVEIVVVDDASNDDTPHFLQGMLESDVPIRVVRNETPQGGAGARNSGIALARGVYVAFLDDDDIWLPEKLSCQINLMKAQPSATSVSCSFEVRHESGKRTLVSVVPPVNSQELLCTNHLGGASMCLATRQALLAIGGFDAALRSGQDWDLWIKLNDLGTVLVCRKNLVCYMPHKGARITSNSHATYWGRRRIYFRYRSRMTANTRKHHLCELVYCRKVLLNRRRMRQVVGLFDVLALAGPVKGFRYLYRYLKFTVNRSWPTNKGIS